MSQQTQTTITSAITSVLMLMFGIPSVAAWFPPGTFDYLNQHVPGFVSAVGVIITVILGFYKLWPKPPAKKVALAAELPQVSRIVASPSVVSSPEVKGLPDAKAFMPTVVTHEQAAASPPPKPLAA